MIAAEELRDCADAVEQVCSSLVEGAPEAFELGAATLEGAARRLGDLGRLLNRGDADALAEAWRLRRNLRVAGALLENAAAYHRGWSERIAVQAAGYGSGAVPAAIAPAGRVWIEG